MKKWIFIIFSFVLGNTLHAQSASQGDCKVLLFTDSTYKYVKVLELKSERYIFYYLCSDSSQTVMKVPRELAVVINPNPVAEIKTKGDTVTKTKIVWDTITRLRVDTVIRYNVEKDSSKQEPKAKTRFYASFNYSKGQPNNRQFLFNNSSISNSTQQPIYTPKTGNYFKGNRMSLELGFVKRKVGMYIGFSTFRSAVITSEIQSMPYSNTHLTKTIQYQIKANDLTLGLSASYGLLYTKLGLNWYPRFGFSVDTLTLEKSLGSTKSYSMEGMYINRSGTILGLASSLGLRIPLGDRISFELEASYYTLNYRASGIRIMSRTTEQTTTKLDSEIVFDNSYPARMEPKFNLENYTLGVNLRFYFNKK